LALYRDPARAVRDIPALAMLTAPSSSIQARAEQVRARLQAAGLTCDVVQTEASVGGGAFPTARIASHAVAIAGQVDQIERRLRTAPNAVIGRIAHDRVLLDLRSVPSAHDDQLVRAAMAALS
jgi:L-seryl-tRNA(Ser) seleniumtransferase